MGHKGSRNSGRPFAGVAGVFVALIIMGAQGAQGAQSAQGARGAQPPAAAPGAISGVVLGRDTRQVVANAVVTVVGSSLTATTGPTGRFTIAAVPVGEVTLDVMAPGFIELKTGAVRIPVSYTHLRAHETPEQPVC